MLACRSSMMAIKKMDPIERFAEWFEAAKQSEPGLPEAMSLATVGSDMMPQVRQVLLKDFGNNGFVFYTNLESDKGKQLTENAQAALCLYWKSMNRSVRINGPVELVSDAEADEYFASRARDSQLGAWASKQSRKLEKWMELEKRVARYGLQFGIGKVPRPDFWSGYRVIPARIEFWEQKPFRLHKRVCYVRNDDGGWDIGRLYP